MKRQGWGAKGEISWLPFHDAISILGECIHRLNLENTYIPSTPFPIRPRDRVDSGTVELLIDSLWTLFHEHFGCGTS